ncbi:hypothetical protein CVT26_013486 [Gymnopilus dilepis]|uniref:Uncharacterized protein n=1 Tax=Gymnopilus dilepis TaxID=231916 RepID=A0A409YWX0_9AGAR|nr:hypothetical protein CVT26_013486 [Gymnopilus dilepis]
MSSLPPPGVIPNATFEQNDCDAKALDWALFILTIISTYVTWWLFPLPTLFRLGFRAYLHDVSWESLRLLVPSMTAFKAIAQDRTHWQMSYYSGVAKPSTRLQDLKAFLKDSIIIVSTILAIYRLCKGGKADQNLSGLNSSLWNYPSLPVAVLGLCVSIFARIQVRNWIMYVVTLIIIFTIGGAMAAIIAVTFGHGIWISPLFILIYMALPLWKLSPKLFVASIVASAGARMMGPIVGAVSPEAYFPFCPLRGWKFSGPLLGIGIVNCILAFYGTRLVPRVEATPPPSDTEMLEK